MRPQTLAPSSPGVGWALPGELERQGQGIPQGPSWWRRDDLTTGLSGTWPFTTSSRKTMAGDPGLSMSRFLGGGRTDWEQEGRREKDTAGAGGWEEQASRPSQQASFSTGSCLQEVLKEVLKGPEEADQEHSWQPVRSHSVPPGKVPEGKHFVLHLCCPGQRVLL